MTERVGGEEAGEEGAEAGPSRLILLGSDRQWLATALETVLEGHGYSVVRAADASELMGEVAEHEPQLVILDSELPNGDVTGTCRDLAELPATKPLPVLVYSSELPEEGWHSDVIDAGAWQLLREPIRAGPLVATVRRVLQIRDGMRRGGERVVIETGQELEISGVMTVRPA